MPAPSDSRGTPLSVIVGNSFQTVFGNSFQTCLKSYALQPNEGVGFGCALARLVYHSSYYKDCFRPFALTVAAGGLSHRLSP